MFVVESHLQLQQPQLYVFLRCLPDRRVQQGDDGGQRQGRAVQHMKQTLVQRLMGAVHGGRLETER